MAARRQPGAVPHRPDGVDAEPAATHCGNSWRSCAGGFAMGTSVGLIVLFVLRPALLGSESLHAPPGADRHRRAGAASSPPCWPAAFGCLAPVRCRPGCRAGLGRLADGSSLWVAAVAGLGIALPSVDYLAALAVILASGAPRRPRRSAALVGFNVVAFALVEIPLVWPTCWRRTGRGWRWVRLHGWLRSRRRRDVAALLAAIGALLVGGRAGGPVTRPGDSQPDGGPRRWCVLVAVSSTVGGETRSCSSWFSRNLEEEDF